MDERDVLAKRFEVHRGHLMGVAFRLLGSLNDAEDAVQETWIRLDRAGADGVEELAAWLTTVVGRICLDMLRARTTRREVSGDHDLAATAADESSADPAHEAILVESVGRALLVVLDRLAPAERVAFVLHDMFSVPFDEVAVIVNRTPVAAKKLASRARLRVSGSDTRSIGDIDPALHRRVVESFLAAARGRNIAGLLEVLDPDVIRRADAAALPPGTQLEIHGATTVVEETLLLTRNAMAADIILIDGRVGLAVAPQGRLLLVLTFSIKNGLITEYSVVADAERLRHLDLAIPSSPI
ncbi:sigma-70 family RNA polymerase sigma factor [Nocardia sp. NPDC004123]